MRFIVLCVYGRIAAGNPASYTIYKFRKKNWKLLILQIMESAKTERVLQTTADGSATIYIPSIDEHYHSVRGALTESRHVYLSCGVLHRASRLDMPRPLRVMEVGFGTGLNAALCASSGVAMHYMAFELYPLAAAEVEALGYGAYVDGETLCKLHSAPWDSAVAINDNFTIEKIHADMTVTPLPQEIDVVLYDAFAPDKQPEMWQAGLFRRVYDVMTDGATLTTYCAKGCVRRMLEAVGLHVERLPGPPGGKREILRATKMPS